MRAYHVCLALLDWQSPSANWRQGWTLTFTRDNLDLAVPQNELQLSVHA